MKTAVLTLALWILLTGVGVVAEERSDVPPETQGVSISEVIAAVARESGKKFMVDPRVQADVAIERRELAGLDYDDLLVILQVHGFAAVKNGRYVDVVPDAVARQLPVPLVSGGSRHPDAEHVSKVIALQSVPAAMLVPILRPLLPQNAHLAALPCRNVLLIVDTFANVKRIETLVQALDTGEPYRPEKCSAT